MPAFSVPLQRKQEPLHSWHLVDAMDAAAGRVVMAQEKMFDVIQTLAPQGWRGALNCDPDGTFKVELNADNPTRQIIARTGDRLVVDFDGIKLISDAVADEFFEDVP